MAKGGGIGTVVKYKIKGGHRYKTVVQYCGKKYIEGGFLTAASARERGWVMKRELVEGVYEKPRERAERLKREERSRRVRELSVEAYANKWLKVLQARQAAGQMSANTYRSYKSHVARYIVPGFEGRALCEVSRDDVTAWHADIASRRSAGTSANAYRVLSSMMGHAVEAGVIAVSPCKVKGASRVARSAMTREQHYFTHEEYLALVETLEACDVPACAVVASFLYYTACRPSEVRALRVGDVDLEQGVVRFASALQRSDSGAIVEGPTKTGRVRRAPLALPLREALEPLVEGRKAGEWLLPSPRRAGEPMSDKQLNGRVRKALDSIGLQDAELYDLKHTCLTNLGRAGASLKELMDLPGHTQVETILKYQLSDFDRVASAVERMAAGLS